MNRTLTISLTILYLSFNAGVLVNFHFCGTAFHHIALITNPNSCCDEESLCCHNKAYRLKISGEYDSVVGLQLAGQVHSGIIPCVAQDADPSLSLHHWQMRNPSGPLILLRKHPYYITNRALII